MEKLEITRKEEPSMGATIFKLSGAVDVFSYKELKAAFDDWTKEGGKLTLLVDMAGVSYVGSSGWSVIFLQTSNMEKDQGTGLVLYGMNERVERSLNIIMPRKRHVNVAPDFEGARGLVETLKNSAQIH